MGICSGFAQLNTVTIGSLTSTTGSYQLPVNYYYNFTYSQQILTSAEIGQSGLITSIRISFIGPNLALTDNWTVYLGHKSSATFSSTSDWVPLSQLTQVFSGIVVPGASWVDLVLTTPFVYNTSAGNLVIAIDENASGYTGTTNIFRTNTGTNNRTLHYYTDGTNPDPQSPPTASYIGNLYNTIQLDMMPALCSGTPTVGVINSSFDSVICGEASVKLNLFGHLPYTDLSYQWQYLDNSTWTNFGTNKDTARTPTLFKTTAYRCIATCPTSALSATTNTKTVRVTNFPFYLGNDTLVCAGDTVKLSTNIRGATYLWNTGSVDTVLRVVDSGRYSLKITRPDGCISADTIKIRRGVMPINVLATDYNLCQDSLIILDAGNPNFDYLWNNSSTSKTILTRAAGNFSVRITSPDNCVINSATTVTLRPLPIISLPADVLVCDGDSVFVDGTSQYGNTYFWDRVLTTPEQTFTMAKEYVLDVYSTYGCMSTDRFELAFVDPPTIEGFGFIPLLNNQLGTVEFFVINPNSVDSLKWYFGDGDSSSVYRPVHRYDSLGTYTVSVMTYNSCVSKDYQQTITIKNNPTSVSEFELNNKLVLAPNPANQFVTITNTSNIKIDKLQIYNSVGQLVKTIKQPGEKFRLDLLEFASGLYQINTLFENSATTTKKLIINK